MTRDKHNHHRQVCRRLFLLAVWLVTIVAVLSGPDRAAARALPAIVDLQVSGGELGAEDGARVTFKVSGPVRFDIFTLTDPYRIVLDLEQVAWRLPQRTMSMTGGLLSRIRYGLFRPGTSRVVLDCRHPAAVARAALVPKKDGAGYRLVIDLAEIPPGHFIAAMTGTPATVAALEPMVPVVASEPTGRPLQTAGAAIGVGGFLIGPPSRKPVAVPGKRVVVIDPGHGGIDPGAISRSGIYEKRVTLAAARLLRDELRKRGHYNVILTRDRDKFIRLRDRVAFGRAAGADLFISVHADANPVASVRGASVYTLSERASDAEAAALAERENKADLIAGVNLSREPPEVANILIDLAQREAMNQSGRFAAIVVDELGDRTPLLRNSHRFAGFAVLKAPDVPSVLVEIGHLSNPKDEKLLQQERYLRKLAAGIAAAVDRYFTDVEQTWRQ